MVGQAAKRDRTSQIKWGPNSLCATVYNAFRAAGFIHTASAFADDCKQNPSKGERTLQEACKTYLAKPQQAADTNRLKSRHKPAPKKDKESSLQNKDTSSESSSSSSDDSSAARGKSSSGKPSSTQESGTASSSSSSYNSQSVRHGKSDTSSSSDSDSTSSSSSSESSDSDASAAPNERNQRNERRRSLQRRNTPSLKHPLKSTPLSKSQSSSDSSSESSSSSQSSPSKSRASSSISDSSSSSTNTEESASSISSSPEVAELRARRGLGSKGKPDDGKRSTGSSSESSDSSNDNEHATTLRRGVGSKSQGKPAHGHSSSDSESSSDEAIPTVPKSMRKDKKGDDTESTAHSSSSSSSDSSRSQISSSSASSSEHVTGERKPDKESSVGSSGSSSSSSSSDLEIVPASSKKISSKNKKSAVKEASSSSQGSDGSSETSTDESSSDSSGSYEKRSTRRKSGVVQDLSRKLQSLSPRIPNTPQNKETRTSVVERQVKEGGLCRQTEKSSSSVLPTGTDPWMSGSGLKPSHSKTKKTEERTKTPVALRELSANGDAVIQHIGNGAAHNNRFDKATGNDGSNQKRKRTRKDETSSAIRENPKPFKRVKVEDVVFKDDRLKDNTFFSKRDTFGSRAHRDLVVTKGKGFRKEKTKKKRLNHHGGRLSLEVNSFKFPDDSD
ncbi:Nucleolar and coiled-body phosphoprotein 1 [Gracilariopsis chorda]|uniref:Nucleolar and coiled-body phosphoprotein 1 n=1 Tax=Gracilariopsis chorda TaxID=448386 RepID=A0A2V3IIQ0_9FLOR|nr:Nucleolar and coiled-body phosphoprotein 1 [Gracilariopsis chorda]|eukprot:PXF41939.1 Nucleolar and coiled-body phosphoprotein 1 [Gracilariopsis chorda]